MSSHLESKIDSIRKLRFNPIPIKPIDVARAVRVSNTTVFVDVKGNVYSTQVKDKCFYSLGSMKEETLRGCQKLGILSKSAVDEHQRMVDEQRKKYDREWAANNIEGQAKTLGIKLTPAQLRAIEAAKPKKVD